jgi:hypothetical protein
MLAGGRVMRIIAERESGAITHPGERSGQWSVVSRGRRLEIGEWRLRLAISDWMLAIGDWGLEVVWSIDFGFPTQTVC